MPDAESPTTFDRPWARTTRSETADGVTWRKEIRACVADEVAVTSYLAREYPEHVPAVVEADAEARVLVLADGGLLLAERVETTLDPAVWRAALQDWTDLQRATIGRGDALLAAGCVDARPRGLPALLDVLLAPGSSARRTTAEPLTDAEYAGLRALRPDIVAVCEQLADGPLPEALHHEDLGGWNILWTPQGCRFFDWAEAGWGHPFLALDLAFGHARRTFHWTWDDPDYVALRDSVLERWTNLAPHAALLRELELALPMARLLRAHVWERLLAQFDPELTTTFADRTAHHLRSLLGTAGALRRLASGP